MLPTLQLKTAALFLMLTAATTVPAPAGILDVVVGVTPSCPEGFMGCWGDAAIALRSLEGVKTVTPQPDLYNSTASVRLTAEQLPDVEKWSEQFRTALPTRIAFRGVEVTVEGTVRRDGDALWLHLVESPQPMRLAALENKLQWNFKKKRARGLEEEEQRSYEELAAVCKAADKPLTVHLTGPLRPSKEGLILEVREFFPIEPARAEKRSTDR